MWLRLLMAGALAVASAACTPPARPSLAEPAPPAAPAAAAVFNAAPEVIGDDLCVGPRGRPHVYPLLVVDADGDRVTVRAETVEPRGQVHPRILSDLASPAEIEIVYEPPANRADENVIVVAVTDARGATTIRRLTARSIR
jgi:hypothetical protein